MSLLTAAWLLLIEVPCLQAQITGVWLFKQRGTNIEIYKKGDAYFGKIVDMMPSVNKETGKPFTDDNNPDKRKRSQPLLGLEIISNLRREKDNCWQNGKLYDPSHGKEFDCMIELIDKNNLKITGYWGWTYVGKSFVWTRVK
jgi:uncharacterized protein (DUF2147 family)